MKQILVIFLLAVSFATVKAQQNYPALLNAFHQHSKTHFKDITGEQTDTASIFYPSKLKPDIGEVKIGKYPNAVTLNWTIPLEQSKKVQQATQEFIKTKFADDKQYQIAGDGKEDEGYVTTNVYALHGREKPLLIFQTIYYRNDDDAPQSSFTITIYGK